MTIHKPRFLLHILVCYCLILKFVVYTIIVGIVHLFGIYPWWMVQLRESIVLSLLSSGPKHPRMVGKLISPGQILHFQPPNAASLHMALAILSCTLVSCSFNGVFRTFTWYDFCICEEIIEHGKMTRLPVISHC